MKALTLSLFLSLVASVSLAQFSGFTIHAGVNYPFLPNKTQSCELIYADAGNPSATKMVHSAVLQEAFQSNPGFDVGGTVRYRLSDRVFLSTGVTVSYITYRRNMYVDVKNSRPLQPGEYSGYEQYPVMAIPNLAGFYYVHVISEDYEGVKPFNAGDLGKTRAWFLQLPVMAGTRYHNDRLTVQGGLTFSVAVYANTQVPTYNFFNGYYPMDYHVTGPPSYYGPANESNTTEQLSTMSVGGIVKIGYLITKRIQAEVSVSPNLTPLYRDAYSGAGTRLTTFSLGMNYVFGRNLR